MSLNMAGSPLGSVVAGWLIGRSLELAVWIAPGAVLAGSVVVLTIRKAAVEDAVRQ